MEHLVKWGISSLEKSLDIHLLIVMLMDCSLPHKTIWIYTIPNLIIILKIEIQVLFEGYQLFGRAT